MDFIENTSVNGKLEEELKNLLQTEDEKALKNVELKKLSSTDEVCHHVSDKSSPTTSRCFESLFFTDLHSHVLKQKRMSVLHGVTKQLCGVELSFNLMIELDDDSNTQVADLQETLSEVGFNKNSSSDSIGELSRSGSLSQPTQSLQRCGWQKTLSHQGSLAKKDKGKFLDCECNVELLWDDNSTSWEPLDVDMINFLEEIAECVIKNVNFFH